MFNDLFHAYEQLAAVADKAFRRMEQEYGDKVKCEIHCTDCCHAVFGLFLIESVYLKNCFDKLDDGQKWAALLRADHADEDLARLQEKLEMYRDDPQLQAYALARQRIRCPLLDDQQNCILYPYRPITCRVYGIPTVINGKARVCWKAGFEAGESYPTFNLDAVYGHLYRLSQELLEKAGQTDMERASFLVSVSKSIKTPVEHLISGKLG